MTLDINKDERQLLISALIEERLRLSSIDNVVQKDLSVFSERRREIIANHKDLENKLKNLY